MNEYKTYQPKWYFVRDKILTPPAIRFIGMPAAKKLDFRYTPYKPHSKTFLMLANHNDKLDPLYELVTLRTYIRFVASDHVVRDGLFGKLINFFGTPIVKHRDRPGSELIKDIKDTIDAGIPVGLHAEGGTSYNGESRFISPNTAKMIKDLDCDVITFRSYGGYLRTPRWRTSSRKGPLFGGVVHEYSKEDIQKMTEEEIYKAITDDLYVNAFEEQRKNPHKYTGENLAEHCEIIVYECPACKTVGRLHSKGNLLKCDCGYTVEFGEDGLFHAVNGGELLQEDLVAWDHWQRTAVQDILDAYKDNTEEPIFRDEHQTVTRIENDGGKTHLTEDAVLELYHDRFELHWDGMDWSASHKDVKRLDFMKEQCLFLITDDVYYEIGSKVPRSPIKYVDAWRYLTGRPNY